MNDQPSKETLAAVLSGFDSVDNRARVEQAERLRGEFVARFPIEAWNDMPLESYALGQEVDGGTVCWWLEFKTKEVGSVSGGSSGKFLIFRSKDGTWRYPKQYSSVDEAWHAVRSGFVEILKLGADGRFDEVPDVSALHGAAAVKTKLLHMYFPDEILPVSSRQHIEHFLRLLGDSVVDLPTARANRRLLALLRDDPALRGLSTQQLGKLLYEWADPRDSVNVVKIAPGERAAVWPDCLAESFICVSWNDVGNLRDYENRDAFRAAFREHYPYNGNEAQVTRKSNELWKLMELEPGDKVIANRGTSEVLAIGTVNDVGYVWRDDRPDFRHTLGVDWDVSAARKIEPVKAWATTTVAPVSDAVYRSILGTRSPAKPLQIEPLYGELAQALERRGQVILYGPPGTGKTYAARRAAVWMLTGGVGNSQAAQTLADSSNFAASERRLSAAKRVRQQVWFMVANPSNWSWSELKDGETTDYSMGRIQRNFPNVRVGDLVVGYEASPSQRVVTLARIIQEYDPALPAEQALRLELLTEVKNGLTWSDFVDDPVLRTSEPIRMRCQGTLFALTPTEADRILLRLRERDDHLGDVAEPSVQQLTRVTFHPSYTYEDFVEGFRPRAAAVGLDPVLTDGIFKQVCSAAQADPSHQYVVLIDEINRGNIPKIFGELITLIEKDKRGLTVRLPQSGDEFSVPSNVFIIGTMNTADRSIHLLDTALRRRFAFIELMPDSRVLTGVTAGALALDVFLDNLNDRVRESVGREKQLGHALFFDQGKPIDSPDVFAAVFRHELLPLIQEYLYEDYSLLETLLGRSLIDVTVQRPTAILDDPEGLCSALADQFGAHASI